MPISDTSFLLDDITIAKNAIEARYTIAEDYMTLDFGRPNIPALIRDALKCLFEQFVAIARERIGMLEDGDGNAGG